MKLLIPFITIFIVLCSNNACSGQVLTACSVDYPPFVIKEDDGRLTGVIPEVLSIIFKELDITVDATEHGNWGRCQHSVKRGEVDVFMAAIINEERKEYAVYTDMPIVSDPSVIFVLRGGEFKFEQWEDLKDKRAGVRLGASYGKDFDLFLEGIKNDVERVSTHDQLYKMLLSERIDFIVDGLFPGLLTVKMLGLEGEIIPLGKPITQELLYAPISKKSEYLKFLPEFERKLSQLSKNGDIKKMIDKYVEYYLSKNKKDF